MYTPCKIPSPWVWAGLWIWWISLPWLDYVRYERWKDLSDIVKVPDQFSLIKKSRESILGVADLIRLTLSRVRAFPEGRDLKGVRAWEGLSRGSCGKVPTVASRSWKWSWSSSHQENEDSSNYKELNSNNLNMRGSGFSLNYTSRWRHSWSIAWFSLSGLKQKSHLKHISLLIHENYEITNLCGFRPLHLQ